MLCSPYLRVIQTATPLVEAFRRAGNLTTLLQIEDGLAETHHVPGCVPGAAQRFASFPLINPEYEAKHSTEATPGECEESTGRPCESYPEGYCRRMITVARLLEQHVQPGGTLVCYSHAASIALAAALLKCRIEDVGKFAACGVLQLSRSGGPGKPWRLERKGESHADFMPRELQAGTRTVPWTFQPEDCDAWAAILSDT